MEHRVTWDTEPLEVPADMVSEKVKASVTVLEFVRRYVDPDRARRRSRAQHCPLPRKGSG